MGRSKKMSSIEILESACQLFWEKGYSQTSMKDLEQATGLKPGSLYHSFKNKEVLFEQVMQHYIETVVEPRIQTFLEDEENDPQVNLRNVFDSIIEIPCEHRWIGCLMTNTSLEVQNFPKLKKMILEALDKFEQGFLNQLNRIPLVKKKSLTHRKKLAHHLLLSMEGFFVLVRIGADDKRLKKHVNDLFYLLFN